MRVFVYYKGCSGVDLIENCLNITYGSKFVNLMVANTIELKKEQVLIPLEKVERLEVKF